MPRRSIEGSAFPTLEQEGRSLAHTDRVSRRAKSENDSVKQGENKGNQEKIDARGS